MIIIRRYKKEDIPAMTEIWNEVVEEGNAFPQTEKLTAESAMDFFASQTYCGVFYDGDELVAIYILHPNNVGRCSHIANASFAVKSSRRGQGFGDGLVRHCIETARTEGFRILQFNAVVAGNSAALKLYEKLGFHRIGTVPNGFLRNTGVYEDIVLMYFDLTDPSLGGCSCDCATCGKKCGDTPYGCSH